MGIIMTKLMRKTCAHCYFHPGSFKKIWGFGCMLIFKGSLLLSAFDLPSENNGGKNVQKFYYCCLLFSLPRVHGLL